MSNNDPYGIIPPFTRPIDDPLQNALANVVTPTGGAPAQPASTWQPSGISPSNPYTPQDQAASQAQMNAINAAGPDVFDRLQTDIRTQRRELLDSIAAAGSAGKAEYQRQAGQADASRQNALTQALTQAQQRGQNDPGTLAAISSGINRPYDEGASARDAANANWQNLFNAIGLANGTYVDQYANSIPVIQQQFKNDLASNFAMTRADAARQIELGRQTTSVSLAGIGLDAARDARTERERLQDQAREDAIRLAEWRRDDADQATDLAWKQKEFDEDARRYGLDYALKQQQLRQAASSGGGGSGSSGYYGTGMTKTELKDALPGQIAATQQTYAGPFGAGLVGGATMGARISPDKYAADLLERSNNLPQGVLRNLLPKSTYTPTGGAADTSKFDATQRAVYNDMLTGANMGKTFQQSYDQAVGYYGDTEGVRNAVFAAQAEYNRIAAQRRQTIAGLSS